MLLCFCSTTNADPSLTGKQTEHRTVPVWLLYSWELSCVSDNGWLDATHDFQTPDVSA